MLGRLLESALIGIIFLICFVSCLLLLLHGFIFLFILELVSIVYVTFISLKYS